MSIGSVRLYVVYLITTVILLVSLGCSIFFGQVSDDPVLACSVTVRNINVVAEPGEGALEEPLSSRATPFLAEDGSVLRNYTLVGSGGGCQGSFTSLVAAATDWRIFARERIGVLAAEGSDDNVFGMYPEDVDGWCAVPETLNCADTGEELLWCEAPIASLVSTAALPDCPPLPIEVCRSVECSDGSDCEEAIDFGQIAVGETATERVTISNCAGPGGPTVQVGVDTVDPVGQLSDFVILDAPADDPDANTCHPILGDGQFVTLEPEASCSFTIAFTPQTAGDHGGEIRGLGTDLEGSAEGGSLSFEDVQQAQAFACAPPGEEPDQLCVDDPATPCTGERIVRVTNAGPGAARIESVQIVEQGPTGFTVEPVVFLDNPVVLGADESLDLDIRWCDGNNLEELARLAVRWDAPANDPCQTFRINLRRNCP